MLNFTTTDIRDLDRVQLARIGGETYYEVHTIVRDNGARQETCGRASEWPLIKLMAENAELTALLTASEERSADADCHVAELITRISTYESHIAALEAALAEQATEPPSIAPAEAETAEKAFIASIALPEAPDDGKIPCDYPGCDARLKPRGLLNHKRLAHGAQPPTYGDAPSAPPPPAAVALELGEAPWSCDMCHTNTHARSTSQPRYCIRCVVASVEHATNGHPVAA